MKKLIFTLITFINLLFWSTSTDAQGLGLNTSGTSPNSSAALDVDFVNKGVLLPRLTTAQRDAIPSPAAGLLIFNIDCSVFNFNAGTPASPNWTALSSANALVAGVSISAIP